MTGDTVECFNCGRANPSWAQVCRSCGVPISAATSRTLPSGPVPTDRESLISMGSALGAVVLAIVVGVIVSGMIPPAAPPPVETPTPEPTPSVLPSPSLDASAPVGEGSAEPTVLLPGTVAFGTGLNNSTNEVTDPTDTFTPGSRFCHSISLTEPFGAPQVLEEVLKIEENGELTVVQERAPLTVDQTATVAGFCTDASGLIDAWGVGQFLIRDYRPGDEPVLLAEGRFTLAQ
ncbi:MAG TPA: hypothetical protein VFH63_01060 [candidate division Zixibacteria bacterium]|nr:hypothetical protein [candidate division Zixibacteria bacterium]